MATPSSIKNPLLLFVVALCAALLIPALFMDGMFIDGMLYSSVSKNFGSGQGSFWYMYFSETHYKNFHEQPPLMFVLQGLFFRVLGNSLYTERVYCFVAAVINSWLILRAWKIITRDATTGWLPLLLWFIMPVTFWAFTNNVEECTMSIFALLAMNAILHALFDPIENTWWWFIAGIWVLAAGLTKGIQGMFLLSAPFWCWIILKNGNSTKFLQRTALISAVPALFVLIAWFTPSIHESFYQYFHSRFVKTFNNETANSDNHFHLLFELLLDVLPVLGLLAVLMLTGRKTPGFTQSIKTNVRTVLFLLVCALSGILPMLVTKEQRGFYLVTALPMIALGAALLVHPVALRLNTFITSRKAWVFSVSGIALLVLIGTGVFTVQNAGKPKRDADKIAALNEIESVTGPDVTFHTSVAIDCDWSLLTLGQRFHGFSFIASNEATRTDWMLLEKGSPAPAHYTPMKLENPLFDLYRRHKVEPMGGGDSVVFPIAP